MCGHDAEVELSWHRHITKNLVIDRKTESKLYLYAKPLKLNSTYYFEGKKIEAPNGELICDEELIVDET